MAAPPRRLPLFGGRDEGPRPATRDAVADALDRGADPVAVVERVAAGLTELVDAVVRAGAPGEAPPACARGCGSCCHQRVEVTAAEAFAIARAVAARADEALAERVRATAILAARRDARAHHLARLPCALLDADGACALYAARPLACRRAHSTDADVCRRVLDDPAAEVRVPDAPSLTWNASALVVGAYEGFAHAGLALDVYELHGAVARALAPGAEARWRAGEDVLVGARTRTADEVARALRRAPVRRP